MLRPSITLAFLNLLTVVFGGNADIVLARREV